MYRVALRIMDIKDGRSNSDVNMILHDCQGQASEKVYLPGIMKTDVKRCPVSAEDEFTLKRDLSSVLVRLELWRNDKGETTQYFVESVTLTRVDGEHMSVFPVLRWLKCEDHHAFKSASTCCTPQDDELPEMREIELEQKKQEYVLNVMDVSLPVRAAMLPDDEIFSIDYQDLIDTDRLLKLIASKFKYMNNDTWKSFSDIKSIHCSLGLREPMSASHWKEDWYFGHQRLAGCDPTHIRLCTSVPDKLAVNEAMLSPMLEGLTLPNALKSSRLFIIDLFLLHHLHLNNGRVVCSPIGLFFLNSEYELVPVAIQLFQDPGLRNPVFFPTDRDNVWTLAKMWFNNAEAQIHHAVSHFAVTHFLMEGLALMLHRHLSEDHPIFKLLAPHFHLLMANNRVCRGGILNTDGLMDSVTSCGSGGMDTIIKRGLSLWRMDVEGSLPVDLKARQVFDSFILPGYHYRDDGLLLYNAIIAYVTKYVTLYYEYEENIGEDFELQSWAFELTRKREFGGLEIQGVPGRGHLTTYDQLVQIATSVIFTCTAGHAAVGGHALGDQYAFVPGYPAFLRGAPPSEKEERPEDEILQTLPDRYHSALGAVLGSTLCGTPTRPLGQHHLQYISDPMAQDIYQRFRDEIAEATYLINWRNKRRKRPYEYLDPDRIGNTPFV